LGEAAYNFLMLASVVVVSWRLIESAAAANKSEINDTYSKEFTCVRRSNAGTFIDTVLPRHLTHHSIVMGVLNKLPD